jgi:hypothetical protein
MYSGSVAGHLAVVIACVACSAGAALAQQPRADLQTSVGHLWVNNGFADRTTVSALGNVWYRSGLGAHAEVTHTTREETASSFVGGLSWNSQFWSIKALGGSSTSNELVLPEAYGRLEATLRSDPATGLVFIPSLTYREYRAGPQEWAVETQAFKYVPVAANASIILQGLGRLTSIDPGDHLVGSVGAGIAYNVHKSFMVGITVEGGRSSYDAVAGIGSISSPYLSVRPHASLYLTRSIEAFVTAEYTDRRDFVARGGYVGLKVHFD